MSGGSSRLILYKLFKYVTYATLVATGIYYTYYEIIGVPYIFRDGVSLSEMIKAYPVTIDVWVWLIWLGVFELETSFIPEEKLKGALKWGLHGVRVCCYVLGISALYGFFSNLQLVHGFALFSIDDVCSLSSSGFSLMVDMPEFVPLDAENCQMLVNSDLYRLADYEIIADQETLLYANQMAWSVIINGVAWWVVVAILEADYWLEERGMLVGVMAIASNVIKALTYSTLIATAVYWGIESGWVDFVDSMLWLAAFVFIDMNILGMEPEADEIQVGYTASLEPRL